MKKAIDEANKASDLVFPNPKVGCVIVQNGKIVSKGFHQKYGGPHAEVEAINSCDIKLKDATMYVTLEPCNHDGKTPPCTALINTDKFKRIVIASSDPNPLINKGAQALIDKGLKVDFNICNKKQSISIKDFLPIMKRKDLMLF